MVKLKDYFCFEKEKRRETWCGNHISHLIGVVSIHMQKTTNNSLMGNMVDLDVAHLLVDPKSIATLNH